MRRGGEGGKERMKYTVTQGDIRHARHARHSKHLREDQPHKFLPVGHAALDGT